jgi:hypothetical protein
MRNAVSHRPHHQLRRNPDRHSSHRRSARKGRRPRGLLYAGWPSVIPAATVRLVCSSTKMNAPVTRLTAYLSTNSGGLWGDDVLHRETHVEEVLVAPDVHEAPPPRPYRPRTAGRGRRISAATSRTIWMLSALSVAMSVSRRFGYVTSSPLPSCGRRWFTEHRQDHRRSRR